MGKMSDIKKIVGINTDENEAPEIYVGKPKKRINWDEVVEKLTIGALTAVTGVVVAGGLIAFKDSINQTKKVNKVLDKISEYLDKKMEG